MDPLSIANAANAREFITAVEQEIGKTVRYLVEREMLSDDMNVKIGKLVEDEVERAFDRKLRQRIVQVMYEMGVPAKEDLTKVVQMEIAKQRIEKKTDGRNYAALLDDE